MILVTVGNHIQGFERLIKPMDQLAGQIEERVVIQGGHLVYEAKHAEYFQFTPGRQMQQLTEEARVQVSHAGAGAILTAFRYEIPLVVAPRLARFEEHIDDHQCQLANILEEQNRLVVVNDITVDTLREAIEKAVSLKSANIGTAKRQQLIQALRSQIDAWFPVTTNGQQQEVS